MPASKGKRGACWRHTHRQHRQPPSLPLAGLLTAHTYIHTVKITVFTHLVRLLLYNTHITCTTDYSAQSKKTFCLPWLGRLFSLRSMYLLVFAPGTPLAPRCTRVARAYVCTQIDAQPTLGTGDLPSSPVHTTVTSTPS